MANLNKVMLIQNLIRDPRVLWRFWSKVNKDGPIHPYNSEMGECWIWTASVDGGGYGQMSLFGRGHSPVKSHRISFQIESGVIKESTEVCHSCDNPQCVRPSHLFLGSHKENMTDAKAKGRLRVASKGRPGESNNQAKLKAADIPVILRLRSEGLSQSLVAGQFGVSRSTISLIERHKKWNTTANAIIE